MQTTASSPTSEAAAPDPRNGAAASRKPVELPISKRKQPWLLYLLILAAAAAFAYWHYFVPKLVAEVTPVTRGDVNPVVYGTVTVEPVKNVMVRPQLQGALVNFDIEKGQEVKKDEVLAEVDDPDVLQKLKSTEIRVKRQEKLLELGPPSLSARDAKRLLVSQLEQLVKNENIPRAEYEKNVAELRSLESKVIQEQLDLEGTLEEAKTALQLARNSDKKRLVTAPFDGVILAVSSGFGEIANPKSDLFLIGGHELQCRVAVNEEDVGDLKEGLPTTLQLYSYPGKEFEGVIKTVERQGTNQEYNVIVTLNKEPKGMMPGMTGEANIHLGKRGDRLIIPTRAVRGSMRSPFVRTVDENGVVATKRIKTGYRSVELCEVTSGLEEGELVIVSDQDRFSVGSKVQIKEIPVSAFQDTEL